MLIFPPCLLPDAIFLSSVQQVRGSVTSLSLNDLRQSLKTQQFFGQYKSTSAATENEEEKAKKYEDETERAAGGGQLEDDGDQSQFIDIVPSVSDENEDFGSDLSISSPSVLLEMPKLNRFSYDDGVIVKAVSGSGGDWL